MTRTLFVGDVHGCADELRELLRTANADRVVLVGDLFTKGPDPRGVWKLVKGHEAVLGNHDDRLLRQQSKDAHAVEVRKALPSKAMAWVAALPWKLRVGNTTAVHAGLHPDGNTTREQALFLRRIEDGRFWWQAYQRKRPVVFGHDARRGLVRVERDGEPYLIGLDSGCVYGGCLTGWLQEEDRYLQVPAKKRYAATGQPGRSR